MWQGGSNGCNNAVAERSWLGGSVREINGSGKTAATLAERTCLTGPGGSCDREVSEMSRQKRWRRSKLRLTVTAGRRRGDRETAVTATSATQIWIHGIGCRNTAARAVTILWQSKLVLEVVSVTAMSATRRLQQSWLEIGLEDLAAVTIERRQQCQDNNDSGGPNLAWKQRQGDGEATARRQ